MNRKTDLLLNWRLWLHTLGGPTSPSVETSFCYLYTAPKLLLFLYLKSTWVLFRYSCTCT